MKLLAASVSPTLMVLVKTTGKSAVVLSNRWELRSARVKSIPVKALWSRSLHSCACTDRAH